MSNEKNQEVVQKKQDDSIRQIPWEKRTMNWGSNTMLWLGDVFPSEHWQWDPHRWRQD